MQDIKDYIHVGDATLLGVRFRFTYSVIGYKPFVASYDGERLFVNCRYGTDEQGEEDKSVIIVPIDHQSFPYFDNGKIHVKREWWVEDSDFLDGYCNIVKEEDISTECNVDVTSTVFVNAFRGERGVSGRNGRDGVDGRNGRDGVDGRNGRDGINGLDGKSAYEIAVDNGFVGSERQWLDSIKEQIKNEILMELNPQTLSEDIPEVENEELPEDADTATEGDLDNMFNS